jgi:mono/diheme cytochrome c family protein/glucose/arabinose dehydrogenase
MNSNSVSPIRSLLLATAALLPAPLGAAEAKPQAPTESLEVPKQPSILARSPQETLKSFHLPKGYRMELVLAEPDIQEPVVAVFDANGRMFVAEMRTYMQDVDGTDEHARNSRISLHWSSKGDGHFDKHTVFLDHLLLPRMILPLGPGQLLVNETDTQDIYLHEDTDHDGVADKKTLWFDGGPRGGNMEHQQSGLIWAMDNWLYMTYNNWRLRWQPGGAPPLKEKIEANGGQWGLTQDNDGKPWIVNAGGEKGPINFQTHILYGGFNPKKQYPEEFRTVWPLVQIPDVQGGDLRFRPEDKTLNHFTATCGAEVFRGDRLPEELRGDLLFSEPVGRLVRRSKIEVKDGLTTLRNPHEKSELIRSTDPLSRVVNLNTAPDGTLYLVDMYRGIIQEGNWVKEGSYLRKVVQQYDLDKATSRGRIWRLVHDDFKPGPQPRLYDTSPAQWVETLGHPNGWWRDTAQRLLVLKQDASTIAPLRQLASTSSNPIARLHALWTLEGLNALSAKEVRTALQDAEPHVRAGALRMSESLVKAGDTSLLEDITARVKDPDASVALQAICSVRLLAPNQAKPLVQGCLTGLTGPITLKDIAMEMLAPTRSWGREFDAEQKALLTRGNEIFNELCFTCHNPDGRGTPIEGRPGVTLAPPLAASRTVAGPKDALVAVLLRGLAGPVEGKTYDAQMVPMESNDDVWIASVASYIRNSFGNKASTVSPKDVALLRAKLKERSTPFTIPELSQFGPATVKNRSAWKLSASHNPEAVARAVDQQIETRYDTKKPQSPGMWFAAEFPAETLISGVILDAGSSRGDYPRAYQVEISSDGTHWNQTVAKGKGDGPLITITFPPIKARAVRITQTDSSPGSYWSIHEFEVLDGHQSPEQAQAAR